MAEFPYAAELKDDFDRDNLIDSGHPWKSPLEYQGDYINLIGNPNFETDATGWYGQSVVSIQQWGSVASPSARAESGASALRIECAGSSPRGAIYDFPAVQGKRYYARCLVDVEANVRGIQIRVNKGDNTYWFSNQLVAAGVPARQVQEIEFVADRTGTHKFSAVNSGSQVGTDIFFIDNVMVCEISAPGERPPYFDGDWEEASWSGTPRNSTSKLGKNYYTNLVRNPSSELTTTVRAISGSVSPTTLTNLCPNPSFETNANSWAAGTGWAISRVATPLVADKGDYALMAEMTTGADTNLASYSFGAPAAGLITSAADIYVPAAYDGGQLAFQLEGFTGATGPVVGVVNMTLRDQWQRVVCSTTTVAGDLSGAIVLRRTAGSNPTTVANSRIYIDGVVLNPGTNTRYFDGDYPGFFWSGAADGSTSVPTSGRFERTNEWSGSGEWSTRYRVTRNDAAPSGMIARTGSGTITGVSDEQRKLNGYHQTVPGGKYGGRIKCRIREGVDVPDYVRLQVAWFKNDGTASAVNSSDLGPLIDVVAGGEYEVYCVSQAPSDGYFADIRLYFAQPTSANGQWQFYDIDIDDFFFTRVRDAAPTENSTIEADIPQYFDGTYPNSSWKGDAHSSASWKNAKGMKILDHGLVNDGPDAMSDIYLPDVYTDTHSILTIRNHPDTTARYGLWARVGNPGTPDMRGYLLQAENNGLSIHYRNGVGVFDNLVGTTLNLNSGDSIGFSVVGNKLEGYHRLVGSETWTKVIETEHDFLSRGVSGIYAQAGATNPNFAFDSYMVGETAWEYSEGTFGVREMRTAMTYQSNMLFDLDVAIPRYEPGDAMLIAIGARHIDPDTDTITPPDGWHLIGNSPIYTGEDPGGMWVYAKHAEEGDDTAKFTFSRDGLWQAVAVCVDGAAPDYMESYYGYAINNSSGGLHPMPQPEAYTNDPMLLTFGYASRPGLWEKNDYDLIRQSRNGEGTYHTTMMGAASITDASPGELIPIHRVRWVDELGKGQSDFAYMSVVIRRPYYKEEFINDWDDSFDGNTIPSYARAGDWIDENYILEVEDGAVVYKGTTGASWGGFHHTPMNVIPSGDHVKVTLDYDPDTTAGGDGCFGVTAKNVGGHLSNERLMAVSYSPGYIELYKQMFGRWYLLASDYSSYSYYNPVNDQEFIRLEMEVDGNDITVKRHVMEGDFEKYTATVNYTLTGSNAKKFGVGTQGTAGFLWAPQVYEIPDPDELGEGRLLAFNITNFTEKITPSEYTVNFIKQQVWRWFLTNSSDMSIVKEIRNARDKTLQVAHLRPGSTSFGVPLNDGSWAGVQPLEYSILCTRKDDPIWSGPIWTLDEDLPTNRLAVTATGWQEILNHRILRTDRNFSGLHFTTLMHYTGGQIIQDLINEQSLYGFFPITFNATTDKIARQRNFTKGQTVGSILQELTDIEAGFDFTIDPITRAMTVKNWDEYNDQTDEAFFAYNFGPKNLQGFRRTFDASSVVNRLTVKGQFGSSLQEDTVSMADLGIMFEEERSLSGVVDPNILLAYTAAEVALLALPKVVYSISPFQWVQGNSVPEPFVDYGVGDLIMFSAKYPPRVMVDKQNARVWSMTVSVDGDNEKVTELQVAR